MVETADYADGSRGEKLPVTRAGKHVAGQLLRSGTSPLRNHGEARQWNRAGISSTK